MANPTKQCSATRQDGLRCEARGGFVLSDGRCISHSVEHRALKLEAVTRGGIGSHAQVFDRVAADPSLTSKRKVEARLSWVSGSVRRGEVTKEEAFLHLAVAKVSWEVLRDHRRLVVLERVEPDRPGFGVTIKLNPTHTALEITPTTPTNGHRDALATLDAAPDESGGEDA